MAVSQKVEYDGFVIETRPAFAWRRWLRFPLYFQAFKPSFEIWIRKESQDASKEQRLVFSIAFADGASVRYPVDVASLGYGQELPFKTPQVLLSPTGDASIRLEVGLGHFHTLYAFFVRDETALVFMVLNVVLAPVAAAIVGLLVRA